MADFLRGSGTRIAVLAAAIAFWGAPLSASAISILGIDINGDVHSISTDDGSFTTLGSVGFQAHMLERSPDGTLYTMSGLIEHELHEINESDYSTTVVASGSASTFGEGGLAFVSNDLAYASTRINTVAGPIFVEVDLSAGTLVGTTFLDIDSSIASLTLRDDGMLVGIAGEASDLVQINPSTAEVSVIADLAGLPDLGAAGLVQVGGVAYFANSAVFGSSTEIWSIDLYTGARSLETTVVGLGGITGIAAIPEPGTAVLFGLGLAIMSARRRREPLAVLALLLPIGFSAQTASAGEIEDMLNEACKGGLLGPTDCAELLACIEDPGTCSSGSSAASPFGFAAASEVSAPGGGMAMMMGPVTGASLDFRVDNSENPRLSPSGARVAFDELNGPRRTHRAVFGDGIPAGTQAPSPSPFGAHSTTLGGIDDGGRIVGSRGQTSAPSSNAYIADASIGVFLPVVDTNLNVYSISSGFDVDFNSTRLAGSIFDPDVGVFGRNYPALWEFDTQSSQYDLIRLAGLTQSTAWVNAELRALTPAGTFGVGASGSSNVPAPNGLQAFRLQVAGRVFTALPFLPSATTNFSRAYALSDATDIIIGTATNSAGNNVATTWFDSGGTYVVFELPRFGGATTSQGLAAAGDGFSLGALSEVKPPFGTASPSRPAAWLTTSQGSG